MNKIICVTFKIKPPDPWTDIIIHQLTELNFEGFEQVDNSLLAYIPEDEFSKNIIQEISDNYAQCKIDADWSTIKDQNWNKLWESNFPVLSVNKDLFIYAPFHKKETGYKNYILLEPKMSFGTGHHATTYMMLEQMLKMNLEGKNVLDVGCGSGILSILAEIKGSYEILAIDIDDWSIENSKENAERNNCHKIRIEKAEISEIEKKSYNVILANINRNIILDSIKHYESLLSNGGSLLMSGFLKGDIERIREAANYLGLIEKGLKNKNDWYLLKYTK